MSQRKILWIEDQGRQDYMESIKKRLGNAVDKITFLEASNIGQALYEIDSAKENIDLCITDIGVGGNLKKFIQELKEKFAEVKVLLYSAERHPEVHQGRLGADRSISKAKGREGFDEVAQYIFEVFPELFREGREADFR
jgi:DNA-binding NarL/FixJ family response regulator